MDVDDVGGGVVVVHPEISIQVSVDALEPYPITMTRDGELTSIDESIPEQVQVFRLDQNYPNPFIPTTNISFALLEPGDVRMRIFDMTGRLMTELVDQPLMAGEHTVSWSAAGVSSGVYMYQLQFRDALLYPTRKDLAIILQRLTERNYPIHGASDHGVSEAIYLQDPDQNGVELYCDRPKEQWHYLENGLVHLVTKPLDLESLMKELGD